jgi:gliding motility-associated-like protein
MKLLKIFLLSVFGFLSINASSQCSVVATSVENNLICGQCTDLNAVGIQGTLVMDNDFNGSVLGPGWTSASTPMYTNPCGPSLDGSPSVWFGDVPFPRTLTTTDYDVSCGGQVCFDLDFGNDNASSLNDCEDPDQLDEGVYFQYSIDGGVTWVDIFYFDPTAFVMPAGYYSWDNYCFAIPLAAQTTNTMFQWDQPLATSTLNDHWGIDNVEILANDCDYYYDWSHLTGALDSTSYGGNVCPTTTTTYNVMYTNGINDTCFASVTVNVLFPDINLSATIDPITICDGCTELSASMTNIPVDECCYTLQMDDSFGDGWNGGFLTINPTVGPALGPFSAVGSGSVITFCVPDGTTFTLNYTPGAWETENTYTLFDPTSTNIFNDGPTPAVGNVFTTTASCGSAPPVYNYTWTGPGLTMINDSTYTACPLVSSWYYVTLDAGGCNSVDSVYIDYTPLPVTSIVNSSVCNGVTYTFPDGSTQVIGGPVTQVSTLVGASVAGCDSIVTTNIVLLPNSTSTQNLSVCTGTTVTFPDGSTQVIGGPVSQVSTLVGASVNGCDSIVTTNVTISPSVNSTQNISVCSGSTVTFPDASTQVIIGPITQVSTLVGGSVAGCDSVITTNVSIVPAITTTQNLSVCTGTTVTFPDASTQVIVGAVTQVSTLVGASVAGCDSIITTNVTLLPNSTSTINVSVCSGDSYTFPDATVNPSITIPVTQVSTLIGASVNGCDSIVTTNVSVDAVYNTIQNVSICEGDNYTFPDGSIQVGITIPVTQVSNLTTTLGCDSIITTNISIDPIYNLTENVSVCDGDSYTYPDGTVQAAITTPVTYISNLTTIIGCDSIITTNVSVDPIFNLVQNVSVCSGSDYTFPDGFIQVGIVAPMSHTSNLTTTLGCDSVIVTSVAVFASFTSTSNFDICSGTDFTFADGSIQTNLTTPTTYVSTLLSIDGCDSLVTENISINPTYNLVENFDQCPGNGFTFPDGTVVTNINNNTTYVSNLLTSNGCDSIITTNVNIYNVPDMDITFTPDGCPLLDMTMTNNAAGIDCNWNVSGPGTSQNYTGCGSISDTYFNSGFYDVTLTMTSVDGCPMDTTITNAFQVYPEPLAQFTWDPNEGNIITNNTINFINTSIGGTYYNWSFGDNTYSSGSGELHTYQDTGHFQVQLVVTNGFGCTDTANGLVIIHEEFFIYVPNSFTPDGDAHNNTFKPIVSGHDEQSYTLYILYIFDRWGEILFESHNSEVGWDGTYKGTMSQDGVYVWKVVVKTNRNLRKEFVGHVTLLR